MAALVFVPGAPAQAVILGPTEIGSPTTDSACAMICTIAQRSSSYVDVAPADGVITGWRVKAKVEGSGSVKLRVIEPSPGGGWVGSSTSAAATNLVGGLNETELAIARGDLIGVDLGVGAYVGTDFVPLSLTDEVLEWRPALGEGGGGLQGEGDAEHLLTVNAEVELTPVVSSVSSASGSTAGGSTVTITGKYLDSARNVVFGTRPATTWEVDPSGEHITAVTPASPASTVDVKVINLHSTSEPVAGDRYTFVAPSRGSGSGTSPGGPGTAALQASAFSESASRWRLGSSLPHVSSTPVGTTFSFKLNVASNVSITFAHVLTGRRASGRCVAPNRANRDGRRCKRAVTAGSLPLAGHAGLNEIRFQGRLSRSRKLAPGNYTATVTTGDHGPKALTRSLSFTILP